MAVVKYRDSEGNVKTIPAFAGPSVYVKNAAVSGDKLTLTKQDNSTVEFTGAVGSVNGQTGVVVLDNEDVGAAASSHTHGNSDLTELSDWAKSANKPTYTASEVGAANLSHTHAESEIQGLVSDLEGKQATISDLATIRSGAALGATALQMVPDTYRTASAQDVIDAGKIGEPVSEGTSGQVLTTDGNGGRSWQDAASEYVLPTASASTKGGVKVGDGLAMNDEVLSTKVYSFGIDKEDEGYATTATNAEIYAKFNAGYTVIAHLNYENQDLPLISATETTADFGAAYGQNVTASGSDVINTVMQMKTVDGVKSIIAHVYGMAKDTDLSNYRTSANQDLIDAGKVNTSDYNPDTKTSSMTQSVGKDSNGKLWTAAGGSSETLIAEETVTQVQRYNITAIDYTTGLVTLDNVEGIPTEWGAYNTAEQGCFALHIKDDKAYKPNEIVPEFRTNRTMLLRLRVSSGNQVEVGWGSNNPPTIGTFSESATSVIDAVYFEKVSKWSAGNFSVSGFGSYDINNLRVEILLKSTVGFLAATNIDDYADNGWTISPTVSSLHNGTRADRTSRYELISDRGYTNSDAICFGTAKIEMSFDTISSTENLVKIRTSYLYCPSVSDFPRRTELNGTATQFGTITQINADLGQSNSVIHRRLSSGSYIRIYLKG